jgi:restriction system protein
MQRQSEAFWQAMSGRAFEIEIGNLFGLLGYEVEVTPAANDYGIDIKLRKDSRYLVVQCKRQVAPVGRPVLQQLFGVMHAEGADECILVCTGGFNRNAVEFAKSRPISLVGLEQIIAHARTVGHPGQAIET